MLVLSRRQNERILFPGFNTSIKVLGVHSGKVSLGIDAPREVTVLREELTPMPGKESSLAPVKSSTPGIIARDLEDLSKLDRQLGHMLRNRLNVVNLGLAVMARQLQTGNIEDGQVTLDKIREDLLLLGDRLQGETRKPPAQPAKEVRTPRALLVEDDQNERELLAGLLRISGMQVDLAGDGADALDYLRSRGRPDIILMDMVLPHCDGPTTVRAIRQDPANERLKIFAVSGHAPESFHLDGVNRWFRKPLNPEELLHDMNLALECS